MDDCLRQRPCRRRAGGSAAAHSRRPGRPNSRPVHRDPRRRHASRRLGSHGRGRPARDARRPPARLPAECRARLLGEPDGGPGGAALARSAGAARRGECAGVSLERAGVAGRRQPVAPRPRGSAHGRRLGRRQVPLLRDRQQRDRLRPRHGHQQEAPGVPAAERAVAGPQRRQVRFGPPRLAGRGRRLRDVSVWRLDGQLRRRPRHIRRLAHRRKDTGHRQGRAAGSAPRLSLLRPRGHGRALVLGARLDQEPVQSRRATIGPRSSTSAFAWRRTSRWCPPWRA